MAAEVAPRIGRAAIDQKAIALDVDRGLPTGSSSGRPRRAGSDSLGSAVPDRGRLSL